jgi:acetyl-CoA carboxylase carboxyl transferase subunit beta
LNFQKKDIPNGIWAKCPECNEIIYNGELDKNLRVCRRCSYYFPMEPYTRISFLVDDGSFHIFEDVVSNSCDRVVMSGKARLSAHHLAILAVNLDSQYNIDDIFISKQIINTISHAIKQKLPLLAIYTIANETENRERFSGQKLSISAVISKLSKENLPYISVLSQATGDSNFPAFAYVADIVIAESNFPGTSHTGSRIGRRESESATNLLFQSGVVDMVVSREELKGRIIDILGFFC